MKHLPIPIRGQKRRKIIFEKIPDKYYEIMGIIVGLFASVMSQSWKKSCRILPWLCRGGFMPRMCEIVGAMSVRWMGPRKSVGLL